MSVYASQRKKSEMQFMATALKIQDEILGRWEHNFGIKFTKRVYDRATGEITTDRLEPYKRWLAEEMAKRMITTVNDMVDSIYRANCIYPAFNFEVEDRRRMINKEWRESHGRKKHNRTPEGRHSDRRFRQHPKPDSNVR